MHLRSQNIADSFSALHLINGETTSGKVVEGNIVGSQLDAVLARSKSLSTSIVAA